jgi:hypothetical protein
MAKRKTYGTFAMDGVRRTAYSPADRVQMRYDGWTEVQSFEEATAAAQAASAAEAGSDSGPSRAAADDDSTKVKGPAKPPADSKTTGR